MSSTIATKFFTVDTNILIYSVDLSDLIKHKIADAIVERMIARGSILPLQCLHEFYRVATSRKGILEPTKAEQIVRKFLHSLPIVSAQPEDTLVAMQIHHQHGLQFFDALMIATARRAGCSIFLTEDMHDGLALPGITLVNPLLLSPEELTTLLN